MSGGMRQRIVGAIAISCEPALLIADEPTTSLDVTIQAQYLNLLRDLQRAHHLALIFITHNLGIVAKMCDQVAVMYAGRMVEFGPVRQIFNAPAHPYTEALLSSIPRLSDTNARLTAIDGQPPDLAAPPPGCAFHPRCPKAIERCREEDPPTFSVGERQVAALLAPEPVMSPTGEEARCRVRPSTGEGTHVSPDALLLEVHDLTKLFTVKRGLFAGSLGDGARGGRHLLRDPIRSDARPRG